MKNLVVTCFCIILAMTTASQDCLAVDVFFTGAVSDSWHDADNWDDSLVPTLDSTDYFIQNEFMVTYSEGSSVVRKLVVGDTSPGTLIMTGGDLTMAGGGDSFQIGRGCCEGGGIVDVSGTAILRTTLNSGVGERDSGVLHIGPDAAVISPNAYWRIGNFGPRVDSGLEGNGLLDVEGTFESRSLFIGVQDGTGVVQVRGTGSVTLTPFPDGDPLAADINMNFNHDPINHPNQSGTIHMIGSEASMSARTLQSQHDEESPIKNLLWFTADAGGVSPITLTEEVNIDNNKLKVDLNDFVLGNLDTLLLIDAAPGEIVGAFTELEVTGGDPDNFSYSVIYDQDAGDILLQGTSACSGFDCVCDFDGNGLCDLADLDELLYTGLNSGDLKYDVDGSGTVDTADRDLFLSEAFSTVAGDFDLDGKVVAADLNILGGNWQNDGLTSYAQGDANGDGRANAADLNAVGSNWQTGAAAPLAETAAVPEPNGCVLVLSGLLGLLALLRGNATW